MTHNWQMMYLGAFIALGIPGKEWASEMAEITRSDDEVFRAITIMRDGKEGDRVYPALEWLRMKRS